MTEKKTTPETEAAHVPATNAEGSNPATEPSAADKDADKGADKANVSSKVWMGTAVGVGSAALVAALMYAKRRK